MKKLLSTHPTTKSIEELEHFSRCLKRKRQNRMRGRWKAHCWIWFSIYNTKKDYSFLDNPFWMFKRWSSQMLASAYNSVFILEIISISLVAGKWALLNSQIQKCMRICCHWESSAILFYNSKELGGAKWFMFRSVISDLAQTRLDRQEGDKFRSHGSKHLSSTKLRGWILKLHRLCDSAGVYPTEDS